MSVIPGWACCRGVHTPSPREFGMLRSRGPSQGARVPHPCPEPRSSALISQSVGIPAECLNTHLLCSSPLDWDNISGLKYGCVYNKIDRALVGEAGPEWQQRSSCWLMHGPAAPGLLSFPGPGMARNSTCSTLVPRDNRCLHDDSVNYHLQRSCEE